MKDAKGEYSKIVGTDEPINEEWLAKQTIEMSADDYDDYKDKSGQVMHNVFYLLLCMDGTSSVNMINLLEDFFTHQLLYICITKL